MRGIYKRIGGGFCALLLSLSLAGCDVPVDVDVSAALDSLTGNGSEGASQVEESSKPHEESGWEAGSSSEQSRPQESSGTHQEKPGRPQQTSAPQESSAGEAKLLTEEQAKVKVCEEWGFEASRVNIIGTPYYDATDWQFIRFNCAGIAWLWHKESLSQVWE